MKYSLIGILSLFLFQFSIAQNSLSLSEAIEKGLQNNYQIQIAERYVDIAENNNNWQSAGRYPTVDFRINSQNNYTDQNNPASFLNGSFLNGSLTGTLDAGYIIFDGYRVKVNKKRFEELEKQGQTNVAIAVENTIRAVMLNYYATVIQLEALEVLEEVLKLSRDRIDYQRARQEFGQAGSFDIIQSRDAYFADSTNIILQQNIVETAFRNLNLAMGEDDLSLIYELTDSLGYDAPNYVYEDLRERMFSNNKNLQNLFISRSLSSVDREMTESDLYPILSINTGANLSGSVLKLNGENPNTQKPFETAWGNNFNYYLNLTASYNIYNGKNRRRAIENAQVEEMIAQISIEDLKRNLSNQLLNTLETYNNQRQLVSINQDRVDNATQNIEISQERFRNGLITSFEYRDVQLSYIRAFQTQLTSVFDLKNTEIELIQLIGGLVR
jgi:outer membrane protein TolC